MNTFRKKSFVRVAWLVVKSRIIAAKFLRVDKLRRLLLDLLCFKFLVKVLGQMNENAVRLRNWEWKKEEHKLTKKN